MMDNLYVMEGWVRIRIADLHAAAAHERLLGARPPRPPLVRRALSAILGVMRVRGELASVQHPR